MKNIFKIVALCVTLSALALSSCIKDDTLGNDDGVKDGLPVTIKVNTSTRTTNEGSVEDSYINSLRVLIYDSRTGELQYNTPITVPTPARLDIKTGTFDFVYIANEHSDTALAAMFASGDDSSFNTLTKLKALCFVDGAFDGVAHSRSILTGSVNIPMARHYQRVRVIGDNNLSYTDPSDGTSGTVEDATWFVPMERLAIRLKLTITLTENQYLDWRLNKIGGQLRIYPYINIENLPASAYVESGIQNIDNSGAVKLSAAADPQYISTHGILGEIFGLDGSGNVISEDGKVTIIYDRIILPEMVLSSGSNVEVNALKLSMDLGSETKSGIVKIPAGEGVDHGYSIPRNTYLNMNVTVKDDNLVIDGEVLPWGEAGGDYEFDGQYSLKVDKSDFIFPANGNGQDINIFTDYPTGWTIEGISNCITAPTNSTTGLAGASTPTPITLQPNTGSTVRTGLFIIRAGNMQKSIRITQLPDAANIVDKVIPNSYVGAFWRSNQTGERLIRIPRPTNASADGKWIATVIAGEDWIKLDTEMTTDPNIGTTGAMNGNDGSFDYMHSVSGDLKSVSGTLDATNQYIYFRIGLDSRYTPTADAPARYGVVLLAYNYSNNIGMAKFERIWIRQGEDADYLMRPTDAMNTMNIVSSSYVAGTSYPNRPLARKFSPYNICDPSFSLGGPDFYDHNVIAGKGGGFVEYPSQAGYYFNWNLGSGLEDPILSHAFAPYNPGDAIALTNWLDGATTVTKTYGSQMQTFDPNYDVCPPGYRHPNDGPDAANTTDIASQSEYRQSLFLTAPIANGGDFVDNSVFGAYADGWFDRQSVVKNIPNPGYVAWAGGDYTPYSTPSTSSPQNSWASVILIVGENPHTAYMGRLYYNLDNNASLFFPATGNRSSAGGALGGEGMNGIYWSSSKMAPSPTNAAPRFMSIYGRMNSQMASNTASVRCVKEEAPVVPSVPLGMHASPGVLGATASGKLTLKGSKVYASDPTIKGYADREFGGLENEYVYVLNFKWGSVVGTWSRENDDPFDVSDIAWAPSGYNLNGLKTNIGTQTGANAWALVPYSTATVADQEITIDIAAGKGDPCAFADKGTSSYSYRTPSAAPSAAPYWNGTAYTPSTLVWQNAANGIPAGSMSQVAGEEGWFFPAAGYRSVTVNPGTMTNQNNAGYYWSSTARGAADLLHQYVYKTNTSVFGGSTHGYSVRCVRSI